MFAHNTNRLKCNVFVLCRYVIRVFNSKKFYDIYYKIAEA